MTKHTLTEAVAARARAMGAEGVAWIENLDALIGSVAADWNLTVGEAMSGGTHAFVAPAEDADGGKFILKIDVPDMSESDYMNEMRTLQIAAGNGYVRLFRVDASRRAALLERLGARLSTLNLPVDAQIEIICDALKRSWSVETDGKGLSDGGGSIGWFRSFIPEAWEKVGRPCSKAVIDCAMEWLNDRETHLNPSEWALVHGDAHNNNTLQCIDNPNEFKLIDPDGIFYEKEYDLGVLMREWPEEYASDPVGAAVARAERMCRMTNADVRGTLAWGYLQMVSTSLVLIEIGQRDLAAKMLEIAEVWAVSIRP